MAFDSPPREMPTPPPGSGFGVLLEALPADQRGQLLASARQRDIPAGAAAVVAGEQPRALTVIVSGRFRVESPDRHGLVSEVAFLEAGDYFGEMSFLRGERASATVRAVGAGRVVDIDHGVLAEIAAGEPALRRALAQTVAMRLSATDERFLSMRPGRVVVVHAAGDWAHLAAWRVAEAAAWHGRGPVVVVERHAWQRRHGEAIDLGTIDAARASAVAATPHEGHVFLADGAGASTGDVSRFAESMRAHAVLVVVCGDEPIAAFDGPFAFAERGGLGPVAPGGAAVVLERGTTAPIPSRRSQVAREVDQEVAGIITGGLAALERERAWPADGEPWRSIDFVARQMLRRTVGLALGAGGAKGYAHIGVIRAMKTLGVPVDYLAGCSIGGPLAAGVAIGMGPRQLKRELDTTFRRAMRPVFPFQSFLSTRRLIGEMGRLANGRTWDDLLIPLSLVATDIETREEVVLTCGPSAECMAASMAIPGIFAPVTLDGRRLVDGGILDPVPATTVAAMGADVVIGVKLADPPRPGRPPKRLRRPSLGLPPIVDLITSAIDVMQWKITSDGSAAADITIAPSFATPVGLRDYRRGEETMRTGEAAALAAAGEIARLLPWVKV